MIEIFKTLLGSAGFNDEELTEFANDFAMVSFLHLVKVSKPKLDEKNIADIQGYWQAGNVKGIWDLLESIHGAEAWQQLVVSEIGPLSEDYRRQVTGQA